MDLSAHITTCDECRTTQSLCTTGLYIKRLESKSGRFRKPRAGTLCKPMSGGAHIRAWVGSPPVHDLIKNSK